MSDRVTYESKTVRTLRGTEERTVAKWQKLGWEHVSTEKWTLQSVITLRRSKPKPPWRLIGALGGFVAIVIVVSLIMSAVTGDGGEEPSAATSPLISLHAAGSSSPSGSASAAQSTPTPSEADSAESGSAVMGESESSSTSSEETLTIDNNQDLASLLAGPGRPSEAEQFAEKYAGKLIEFDANIGEMTNHGNYDTRFDILILAGDYSTTEQSGPPFQFRDVNTVFDLHYTDSDRQGFIGVGDNLRVIAEVVEFEELSELFLLEPVSTEFR